MLALLVCLAVALTGASMMNYWWSNGFAGNGLLYAVIPMVLAFAILAWRSRAYRQVEIEKSGRSAKLKPPFWPDVA